MTAALLERIAELPSAEYRVSAKEAEKLITEGRAPENMRVSGYLDLSGCVGLSNLPDGLHCSELNLSNTTLRTLPADLRVDFRLDCTGCAYLQTLPIGLKVGSLILRDCASLEALPEGLNVSFLDISGCLGMHHWPQNAQVQVGRFVARGCMQFTELPDWLADVAQLDLSGCANITELPAHLRVRSWIDIANTGIAFLPPGVANAQIRWRGVTIDSRIAFQPETIDSSEILGTVNVELRRVLMERMGYEAFMAQAQSETLDTDTDAGGERQLLRVPIAGDEPLVCVSVFCPFTGRQYMLRVPPQTRTCHQAAAWLAGFDNADDYQPVMET